MKIGNREVRNYGEPYVIAEIGANHNGDMVLARKLIDAAKSAGADCVKFQSWSKDTLFSRTVYENDMFLTDGRKAEKRESLEDVVERYSISARELAEMKAYADERSIDFGCTPFSEPELDFLVDELDVPFIKVASMDVNNYAFLDRIARKGPPTVLSTGLASLDEIDRAVRVFEEAGNRELVVLHCVAQYPPDDGNINLNNIDMLRDTYPGYPVGFSDHTIGTAIPLAAIAKGAGLIEKHFTLDHEMEGWDHRISATPEEMAEIVEQGRRVARSLGSYRRVVTAADIESRAAFRRSIVAARPIAAGKVIERGDLDFKRPGTGIAPEHVDMVVGRVARRDIAFDRMLESDDF